jgi:YesN/AraC family two-component response regulator
MPFMFWAQESGYTDELTIDRVDPNGNYCPENCKWVTVLENARNRRTRTQWKRRSNTKISAEQVQAIVADYKAGMTLKALGIKHGVSPAYAGELGRGVKRVLDL